MNVPVRTARIYCIKMSSHPTSSNKLGSSKCRHFCLIHITTVQLAEMLAKGMTLVLPMKSHVFAEEQLIKIKRRRRYVRKQKASDTCNTSKKDDLHLLADDVEAFSGSQAYLQGTAENLFSSPPRPPTLTF